MTGTPTSFNLIDEPWITVVTDDGAARDVSLAEAFAQARQIRRIVGEVPTQSFAILRLLLAILHRASGGPQSIEQWQHASEHWDDVVGWVNTYLEAMRGRFDLRDPAVPFFQVAGLHAESGAVSGLDKLIADVPNGEPYFTTRIGRGIEQITWAEAARWVVHVQAFDPNGIRTGVVGDDRSKGGRSYPIGPAWAGQLGGLHAVGSDLAATLLLNLVVPDAINVLSGPDDLPVWEREPLGPGADLSNGGEPRGLVDLYTWQARRVLLVGDVAVTGLVLGQGDRMTPQNRHFIEPLTAWRFSDPQTKRFGAETYMAREHDPERALWRGLSGLLPHVAETTRGAKPARFQVPGVVSWVSSSAVAGVVGGSTVQLRAVGVKYGSNQSTFAEIIDDEVMLPLALLTDAVLAQAAVDAVNDADAAVQALGALGKNVAVAAGASTEDDGPWDRARERAYASLDEPYRAWLATLGTEPDPQRSRQNWQEQVRQIVFALSRPVVEQAGVAAWVGRTNGGRHVDLGLADAWFLAALRRALPLAHAPQQPEHPSEENA